MSAHHNLIEQKRAIDLRDLERQRRQARQNAISRIMDASAVPPKYADATLGRHHPLAESAHARAHGMAKNWLTFFFSSGSDDGMFITGDIGTGKTYLACAVLREVMMTGKTGLYSTAMESIALIRSSWRRDAKMTESEVYASFAAPDVFILDEIGVQSGSSLERSILTSIIDARVRRSKPTVAVSNLGMDAVHAFLGDRAMDRIFGGDGILIEMRGPSLRGGLDKVRKTLPQPELEDEAFLSMLPTMAE